MPTENMGPQKVVVGNPLDLREIQVGKIYFYMIHPDVSEKSNLGDVFSGVFGRHGSVF